MEHLIISGGEQYLPFARSRIKALRALGRPFASQKFEVGGCSVHVRIEGAHEFITLGGGKTEFLLFIRATLTNETQKSKLTESRSYLIHFRAFDVKKCEVLDATQGNTSYIKTDLSHTYTDYHGYRENDGTWVTTRIDTVTVVDYDAAETEVFAEGELLIDAYLLLGRVVRRFGPQGTVHDETVRHNDGTQGVTIPAIGLPNFVATAEGSYSSLLTHRITYCGITYTNTDSQTRTSVTPGHLITEAGPPATEEAHSASSISGPGSPRFVGGPYWVTEATSTWSMGQAPASTLVYKRAEDFTPGTSFVTVDSIPQPVIETPEWLQAAKAQYGTNKVFATPYGYPAYTYDYVQSPMQGYDFIQEAAIINGPGYNVRYNRVFDRRFTGIPGGGATGEMIAEDNTIGRKLPNMNAIALSYDTCITLAHYGEFDDAGVSLRYIQLMKYDGASNEKKYVVKKQIDLKDIKALADDPLISQILNNCPGELTLDDSNTMSPNLGTSVTHWFEGVGLIKLTAKLLVPPQVLRFKGATW